jgi:hypothetical protein
MALSETYTGNQQSAIAYPGLQGYRSGSVSEPAREPRAVERCINSADKTLAMARAIADKLRDTERRLLGLPPPPPGAESVGKLAEIVPETEQLARILTDLAVVMSDIEAAARGLDRL